MNAEDDLAGPLSENISSFLGRDFPPDRIMWGDALKTWAGTTHALRWCPKAVLRPRIRSEVSAIVRALGPSGNIGAVSRGRNIGLGGRIGPARADHIVDLGDLRRISDYDGNLGTITVEAGTSFQEVHDFLERRESNFFLPAIGGPPDASVVGNTLQRGDGIGPGGHRHQAMSKLEVVLRNGRTIDAGFGPLADRTAPANRLGADLTGLFVQSDLGIVTRATFALTRMPAALLSYCVRLDIPHQLGVAIDLLRECTAQGVLQPCCGSLWSEGKRSARLGIEQSRKPSRWFVSGAFYGASVGRVRADWDDLTSHIARAQLAHTIIACDVQQAPFPRNIFTGRPSDLNMPQVGYGLAKGSPTDPRACGFAWVCPTLPFSGSAVQTMLDIAMAALKEADLAENLALHPHSTQELRAFIALAWDRRDPEADRRAHACHDRMLKKLTEAGFPPFRLGHLSSERAQHGFPDARQLAELLGVEICS